MATDITHALSSVRKWGGVVEDYLPIHRWFDETKELVGDFRHRALRHHLTGVKECIERFGNEVVTSEGRRIPTRHVAEQHLLEDFGKLPTLADWMRCLRPEAWMAAGARKMSLELEKESQVK